MVGVWRPFILPQPFGALIWHTHTEYQKAFGRLLIEQAVKVRFARKIRRRRPPLDFDKSPVLFEFVRKPEAWAATIRSTSTRPSGAATSATLTAELRHN